MLGVMNEKPLVSIVCTTYNQEKYIIQTLDGIISQCCDFKYEIIVHDDASSDSTVSIVKDYEKRYPELIKAIYQIDNQYSIERIRPFESCISIASGKYIAICEGDDYWVDANKLQAQVDLLENHEDIALVHSNCYDLDNDSSHLSKSGVPKSDVDFHSLVKVNSIRTMTIMVRKNDVKQYLDENRKIIANWMLADWPLWLYLSTKGKVFKLEAYTSVYRVLNNSASHFISRAGYYAFANDTLIARKHIIEKYALNDTAAWRILADSFVLKAIYPYDFQNKELVEHSSILFKMIYSLSKFFPLYKLHMLKNRKNS